MTMQEIHYSRLIGAGYSPTDARRMIAEYYPQEPLVRIGQKLVSGNDVEMVTDITDDTIRVKSAQTGRYRKVSIQKLQSDIETQRRVLLPQVRGNND